eukprot:662240-Rhodomonas_salina.2
MEFLEGSNTGDRVRGSGTNCVSRAVELYLYWELQWQSLTQAFYDVTGTLMAQGKKPFPLWRKQHPLVPQVVASYQGTLYMYLYPGRIPMLLSWEA